MDRTSLNKAVERARSLIKAARENVFLARDLCEVSCELLNNNSDFREFLREQRLRAKNMRAHNIRERWVEEQARAKTPLILPRLKKEKMPQTRDDVKRKSAKQKFEQERDLAA